MAFQNFRLDALLIIRGSTADHIGDYGIIELAHTLYIPVSILDSQGNFQPLGSMHTSESGAWAAVHAHREQLRLRSEPDTPPASR